MTQEDLLQLRYNVLTNVTRLPSIIMDRKNKSADYDSDITHLNDLEEVLEQIETIYAMGRETASIILGNEFIPNEMEKEDALEVPLYLYLDVMINLLIPVMNDTAKLDIRKNELLKKLKNLREKATKLPHHHNFKAKKHLSELAIKNIMRARGDYYFSIIEEDNKRYLSIVSVPQGQAEIAYQEDYNRIEAKKRIQSVNYITKIQNHIAEYFQNNVIPDSTSTFNKSLKDPSLDKELKANLYSIVEIFSHETSNQSLTLEQAYSKLCDQEQAIKKKHSETKKDPDTNESQEDSSDSPQYLFTRYKEKLAPKQNNSNSPQLIELYEQLRKKQILQDEERRNQYISNQNKQSTRIRI